MNIFHLPSWFPSKRDSFSGIFVEDFILNFADLYPEHNHFVSLFSASNYYLNPRNILGVINEFVSDKSKSCSEVKSNNLKYYYSTRTITLPPLIHSKVSNSIIKVNEIILEEILSEVGHIDLIHGHVTFQGGQIAAALSKKYSIPYVITEHFGPFPQTGLKYFNKLKPSIVNALTGAKKLVAVSNHLSDSLKNFGNFDINLIPNFVNEDVFLIKQDYVKKPSTFIFYTQCLMNGKRKGIDILLHSAKLLINDGFDVEFRIGGSGTELNNYKRLAIDLKIDVQWLGSLTRDQIVTEYNNADCFILTSFHENFGIVFAEATACGTPIIASDSGGPSDIVSKKNGLLVPVNDISATKEAMINIIQNRERYKSEDIRNEFMQKFSKTKVLEQYNQLYIEVGNSFILNK